MSLSALSTLASTVRKDVSDIGGHAGATVRMRMGARYGATTTRGAFTANGNRASGAMRRGGAQLRTDVAQGTADIARGVGEGAREGLGTVEQQVQAGLGKVVDRAIELLGPRI